MHWGSHIIMSSYEAIKYPEFLLFHVGMGHYFLLHLLLLSLFAFSWLIRVRLAGILLEFLAPRFLGI